MDRSRADGYQEALEDLVGFLDKENLGVGDGEGWLIRQWAMERLDGGLPIQPTSDSDEEPPEEQRARSSSPVMDRNSSPEPAPAEEPMATASLRSDSAPPLVSSTTPTDADMAPLPSVFQFSSPQAYPATVPSDGSSYDFTAAARRAFPTPRRSSHRTTQRNLQRSAAQNVLSLGSGAGHKRKMVPDYFNIEPSDRRDGPCGGSKRGRMT